MRTWFSPQKRSGYECNLGSLRAGTRHHGEFSVMGTPPLQPFLKSYWLTAVNWLANCRKACKYDELERQYKCRAHDNYVRIWYWTPLGWTSSDHVDHRDVSFPLSGNRGYISNRSVPFRAFTRHHGEFSVMGTLFNPAMRGLSQPPEVSVF